jgi:hypothetical protein
MTPCNLTAKLRARTTTPDGAEGAQSLSARGTKPQAHHGPLQRLLGGIITGTSILVHGPVNRTTHGAEYETQRSSKKNSQQWALIGAWRKKDRTEKAR